MSVTKTNAHHMATDFRMFYFELENDMHRYVSSHWEYVIDVRYMGQGAGRPYWSVAMRRPIVISAEEEGRARKLIDDEFRDIPKYLAKQDQGVSREQ